MNKNKIEIYPSILPLNELILKKECENVILSGADGLHVDIMDGIYVNNKSFNIDILKKINHINTTFDVHLMVEKPIKLIKNLSELGANSVTFHLDSNSNTYELINECKKYNLKIGIALNPKDNCFTELTNIIQDVDIILIMGVQAGFGGQSFIYDTFKKIEIIKKITNKLKPNIITSIDGGINQNIAKKIIHSGADRLIAGTAIFSSSNYSKAITELRSS